MSEKFINGVGARSFYNSIFNYIYFNINGDGAEVRLLWICLHKIQFFKEGLHSEKVWQIQLIEIQQSTEGGRDQEGGALK